MIQYISILLILYDLQISVAGHRHCETQRLLTTKANAEMTDLGNDVLAEIGTGTYKSEVYNISIVSCVPSTILQSLIMMIYVIITESCADLSVYNIIQNVMYKLQQLAT